MIQKGKKMESVSQVITALQLIISSATVITLIYGLIKFAGTPNRSQNKRLDELEEWRKTVDRRLSTGDDHFREIDNGNRVTQKAILALMKHAINGNDVDSLRDAEEKLEEYLVEK